LGTEFDRAKKLCDDYRKKIFKTPLGSESYKNASAMGGLLGNRENDRMFDSFHEQECIICKDSIEGMKLLSRKGGYYFKCKKCSGVKK
jgi:hypothetical protein